MLLWFFILHKQNETTFFIDEIGQAPAIEPSQSIDNICKQSNNEKNPVLSIAQKKSLKTL